MEPKQIPIDTRSLFKPLDGKLLELLKSLSDDDWTKQTVAKAWNVKDVASHLLDGNLRTLSIQRDQYFGETSPKITSYESLVDWLNMLNADWVKASKRLSPDVLILLLEVTGQLTSEYYASLNLWDTALFSVDWAGESSSYNWMHVAREYTEKWHHQQQIRDAVGIQGIMTKEYFYPVMDTFFKALPHTFRNVDAKSGTTIKVTITSESGGSWYLSKTPESWVLISPSEISITTTVEIPMDISWKLFSKSLRPDEITDKVKVNGNIKLGEQVLEMVAVMA